MWALTWHEVALDRMAERYVDLDPADRDQLARDVAALNARLRSDPQGVGESRDGGNRVTFVHKLVIDFHVDKTARRVTVEDARPSRR